LARSFPGCTHTRFLHGHHWRHWLHGGETSLANLLLLCPFHHGLVHEGGWSVERDEEGRFTFVAPTGKSVGTETREEWHGKIETLLEEWAEAHGLELGPETNEPLWDGSPLDYGDAVSGLMAGQPGCGSYRCLVGEVSLEEVRADDAPAARQQQVVVLAEVED
jgi:hypothetical protein